VKKFILIIAAALSLSACATPKDVLKLPRPAQIGTTTEIVINGETVGKAPAPKVPALPDALARKAGALPPLTDPSVAGQQKDAADTDRRYNDVAHQLNNVIDAWFCVKDALNEEKDAKACFTTKAK
jgi:hypothetical protein